MCHVSGDLRELVRQRLAAAAEEIFELVERTITGYEEETQRQRKLLEQLLQPRIQLHRVEEVLPEPTRIKEEQEPERPSVKQEQDIIISQLCSGLKTEELLSASTWDPNPPQTQPGVGSESWAPLMALKTEEELLPPSQNQEKPLLYSYTKEESLPLTYTDEGLQLSNSYTEEGSHTFTQPFEEPLPPSYTEEEPLSPSYTEEEPLPPSYTEEEPLPPSYTEEEPLSPSYTEEEPLPPSYTEEEPLPLFYTERGSQTFVLPKEELLPPSNTKKEPLPSPPTPSQAENETSPFLCVFCNKVFRCKSLLVTHMRVHTGERPFRCSFCMRSFTRTAHLDRHFLAIHGCENPEKSQRKVQRYSCVVCNRKCISKYTLDKHMKVHAVGARLMEESSLKLDLQIHTQGTSEEENTAVTAPLEDSTAPAEDRTEPQSSLSHVKRSAKSNSRQKSQKFMKCPICCKIVQTARLSRHIVIHTGEKPFRCSVCGKSFARKDALQAHMIVHSEERPFTCSVCGISKKRKGDIREHMHMHTRKHKNHPPSEDSRVPAGPSGAPANVLGNNKKVCPICGKVVICLKKHMVTHSGVRPFSCSYCGKRFLRNQHLQRHKVLHTRTSSFSPSSSDPHEKQDVNRSEPSIIYCRIDD